MITFQSDGIGQNKWSAQLEMSLRGRRTVAIYLKRFSEWFWKCWHDSRRHWFSIGLSMGASPKCLVDVSQTTGNSCNSMLRMNFGVLPMFSWNFRNMIRQWNISLRPIVIWAPAAFKVWKWSLRPWRWPGAAGAVPDGLRGTAAWHGMANALVFYICRAYFSMTNYDNLWQLADVRQLVNCNVCFDEIWIL